MREQSLRPLEESQRQDTGAIPGTPLTGSETVAPASLLCLMRDFEIGVGEKVVSEKQQDPSHWMEMEAIPNHPSLFCAELFRSTVKPPLERRRQIRNGINRMGLGFRPCKKVERNGINSMSCHQFISSFDILVFFVARHNGPSQQRSNSAQHGLQSHHGFHQMAKAPRPRQVFVAGWNPSRALCLQVLKIQED